MVHFTEKYRSFWRQLCLVAPTKKKMIIVAISLKNDSFHAEKRTWLC